MKTRFIIFLFLLAANLVAISQNLIAVQNGGTPVFYLQVDTALIHSQDGDTIYIPGGVWNVNQPINKLIHVIGVGYNSDSTIATFPSTLNGNITLATGASNGTLSGVLINGTIVCSDDQVNNYNVMRCHIVGGPYDPGIHLYQSNSNFTFIENIIDGICFDGNSKGNPSNYSFFNNVIGMSLTNQAYSGCLFSSFKNNVFVSGSDCWLSCHYSIMSAYSMFENNIFIGPPGVLSGTNILAGVGSSTFKNNLFASYIEFPINTNEGLNNIVGQDPTTFFSVNYHLQPTNPGKNAGTDGTDIGIYGGMFPWKDGAIPYNPHFQSVSVAPKTDASGNLNVNIKVAAQDR